MVSSVNKKQFRNMNNYIPLNKAVGPKLICDGEQALIPQKLGVDAMTFNFDGSACEHATCAGAPEMFIKVEEDGLYYFGVEADDTGSISIAGDVLCKKDGTKPNGKLNLATGARYLKAGYYKVALSYTNNAYTPVSNNAAAFNVTMDREPIQEGKYEGNSTMKREFSPSPKIKLWTIEKESTITCEPSKNVEFEFEKPEPVTTEEEGNSQTKNTPVNIVVTVCKDETENVWRCRVVSASGGATVVVRTGSFIDALLTPPTNEEDCIMAVNDLNGYQSGEGLGIWHTAEASLAHEEHHRRQWEDAYKFYWKHLKLQEKLEEKTLSCDKVKDMETAIAAMDLTAVNASINFMTEVIAYIKKLPDNPGDRPYCAGQKVLNNTTRKLIRVAEIKGWSKVPTNVTEPGIIEPPCFLPPVNEGKTRSMAIAEVSTPLQLSIVDTANFMKGEITVSFRNEGNEPVRIPDEINDETSDFFFVTVLRTQQGKMRILNREIGTMTFQRPLNYRELAPGQEYSVTIPVCLDEVDLEGWKQCSCELETRYYNQQGKDCFLGMLRATAKLML